MIVQEFLLFVSGMSVKSVRAIENIHLIAEKYFPGNHSIKIIDINVESDAAVTYQIVAIPTLMRINPEPRQIIIGDLNDLPKVMRLLDINDAG